MRFLSIFAIALSIMFFASFEAKAQQCANGVCYKQAAPTAAMNYAQAPALVSTQSTYTQHVYTQQVYQPYQARPPRKKLFPRLFGG